MNSVWEQLGENERRPFRGLLQAIADYQVRAIDNFPKPLVVEVFASTLARDRFTYKKTLVLHFLFSHYLECFAQSGSDWDEHHFHVGVAKFVNGVLASVTIAHQVDNIPDSECAKYEIEPAVAAVRAAAIAGRKDP